MQDYISHVRPKDIKTDHWFMGSEFRNAECETVLRNIVLLQQQFEDWTPFTWDDYIGFCTHSVTLEERSVLDTFVTGGKSPGSAWIEAGWLDEGYVVTPKLIKMLERWKR